jgi:hypothetical protein
MFGRNVLDINHVGHHVRDTCKNAFCVVRSGPQAKWLPCLPNWYGIGATYARAGWADGKESR